MVCRYAGIFFILLVCANAYAFDHRHAAFDQLLQQVVVPHGPQTDVDYALLKTKVADLDAYLEVLQEVTADEYHAWDPSQQLAFLINAYNAFTLKLIVMHYPEIDSIRDLGGLIFSSPWDIEFFQLLGKPATLDIVEHDLIRKNFAEPRIHFAVNCASRGCPPLQTTAYTAEKLDAQLEHATRQFLRDPERNRYVPGKKRLELSSIFNWYKPDFEQAAGSIEKYVAPYITDDPETRTLISNHGASRSFLDYDWALNDKATRK